MDMERVPAIEINDLTIRLDEKTVLDHLSLRIDVGERVIFTGPSGCGKTTLFRAILGFIEPVTGSIFINGTRLTSESVWTLRAQLGYVAQEPDLGTGNVREVLERPLRYRANGELRQNLVKVPDLFDQFALPRELLDKEVTSLSGGEKQRLALIGAILLNRKIYLLDEATSALDQANREIVLKYFREHENLTVLSITHANDTIDPNQRVITICPQAQGGK